MGTRPSICRWAGKWTDVGFSLTAVIVSAVIPTAKVAANPVPLHPVAPDPVAIEGRVGGEAEFLPWQTVPSVNQLALINVNDWEYQALLVLAETYDLKLDLNEPPGLQEPLTRYEFVATLMSAIAQLDDRVRLDRQQYIGRRDYEILARLVNQFDENIGLLDTRVTDQESRTAFLEASRFSPTARLHGEAIIALNDQYGGDRSVETTLQHRLRLEVATSFSGRDRLHTRFVAGGTPPALEDESGDRLTADDTGEGILVQALGGDTDSQFDLDWLAYEFPLGNARSAQASQRFHAYVSASGGLHSHYVNTTISPYFDDGTGGNGSISAFSQFSPIYSIGGGTGVGLDAALDNHDRVAISLGYMVDRASQPDVGSGLFNGDYSLLGQVTLRPTEHLQLGVTYVHGFHSEGEAIFDFDGDDPVFIGTGVANQTHTKLETSATTHSVGLQAAYRVSPSMTLNVFGGYTDVQFQEVGQGDIWYYGMGMAFPDLVLPNSLAGLMVGVEPYLGGIEGVDLDIPNATSLHVEVFYKLQLTDSIALTPGLIWITAPNQESDHPDFVVSTIRTTFRF